MGKKNNFIDLNGKRYDALTGELFVGSSASPQKPSARHNIDDVVRSQPAKHIAKPAHQKTPEKPSAAHYATKPTNKRTMDVVAVRGQHHLNAHQPEHPKTLMRHAVKKPLASLKRQAKVQTRTDILAKTPGLAVLPKFSFHTVDPERLARAKRIAKSRLIRRFAPLQSMDFIGVGSASTSLSLAVSTPTSRPNRPTMPPVQPTTRSMDIFQQALTHATSHEQPAVKPQKHAKRARASHKSHIGRRALNTAATALAVLLIAGFVGYQNKANITMHIASGRAGLSANLPSYKPAGFAVGNFQYSAGVVAVNFHRASDNRNYSVIQKSSNWDSAALLDNYVAVNNKQYQTFLSGGRTIYVYGNNNASWVNNGIWYQVNDNGDLSTNQVLQLAQSM